MPGDIPAACAALGLERLPGLAFRMAGRVDGVWVSVHWLSNRGNERDLAICAWLPHPTDFGWMLAQGGSFASPRGPALTGDADFDGLIDVAPGDAPPEALRALLSPALRAQVLQLVRVGAPTITDDLVGFYTSGYQLSAEDFTARLRWCVDAARSLDLAAAALPPTPALPAEVAARFAEAARARGMSLRHNVLCAEGALPTVALYARVRAADAAAFGTFSLISDAPASRAGVSLRGRFHEPLGVGLALRPAGLLDRAKELVGRGDLHLGDDAFDRAWAVSATDADGARAILHDGARAQLQRLAALGLDVTLTDAGFAAEGAAASTAELLPQALWLIDGLRDTLRPRARGGAYR